MNKGLYTTAFVSGFVLMGFEVFGTRVLTPYFGSGMHVWGALISVVLGGLSLGYAIGGSEADKTNPERKLIISIAVAGLLLILFSPLSIFVCQWIDSFKWGRKISTLVSAILLFLPPAFFIGMISPILVKLKVRSVNAVGKGAGMIYSIATAGSIAGTLLTAFFLIGKLPSSKAISIFGMILILNAILLTFLLKASKTTEEA